MKASSESGADRYRRWLTRPGFSFLCADDEERPVDPRSPATRAPSAVAAGAGSRP